jgi:rare lipoprotein A (peptidoglycan hydrolase)
MRAVHIVVVSLLCGLLTALGADPHQADAARRPAAKPTQHSRASAYGPGLFGNHTACGQLLDGKTVGVAHRSLPCGTKLAVRSRSGRWVPAVVVDRGPYHRPCRRCGYDRTFDLTFALVRQLGYGSCRTFGVRTIAWRRTA